MPTFVTTPAQLGVLIRTHERQRVNRVTTATRISANDAAKILRAAAPKASRELANSIEVTYTAGGIAEVAVTAPYSGYVEQGCRPHMPPIAPLIEWAMIVKKGEDPRDVAWRIALKIKAEGIRPTWFVRNSLYRIVQATAARVTYVLEK